MNALEALQKFGKCYIAIAILVLFLDKIITGVVNGWLNRRGLVKDHVKCAADHKRKCECNNCGYCKLYCSCGWNNWWRLFQHITRHKCEHRVANFMKHVYSSVENNRVYESIYILYLGGVLGLGISTLYLDKVIIYDEVEGTSVTTTNVFGLSASNVIRDAGNMSKWLDPTDIAVPAQITTQLFITTKFEKLHQRWSTCPEHENVTGSRCNESEACDSKKTFHLGNGVTTGNCTQGRCEIQGWCPVEFTAESKNQTATETVDVKNVTISIRNHVYFVFSDGQEFVYNSREYVNNRTNNKAEQNLTYTIDSIVEKITDLDKSHIKDEILKNGTVIFVRIKWTCYVEDDVEPCSLTIMFTRMDKRRAAQGYSYTDNNQPYNDRNKRTFIRASGLLLVIEVDSIAYKVSWSSVLIAMASAFVLIDTSTHMSKFLFGIGVMCASLYLCCHSIEEDDCPYGHPETSSAVANI